MRQVRPPAAGRSVSVTRPRDLSRADGARLSVAPACDRGRIVLLATRGHGPAAEIGSGSGGALPGPRLPGSQIRDVVDPPERLRSSRARRRHAHEVEEAPRTPSPRAGATEQLGEEPARLPPARPRLAARPGRRRSAARRAPATRIAPRRASRCVGDSTRTGHRLPGASASSRWPSSQSRRRSLLRTSSRL